MFSYWFVLNLNVVFKTKECPEYLCDRKIYNVCLFPSLKPGSSHKCFKASQSHIAMTIPFRRQWNTCIIQHMVCLLGKKYNGSFLKIQNKSKIKASEIWDRYQTWNSQKVVCLRLWIFELLVIVCIKRFVIIRLDYYET